MHSSAVVTSIAKIDNDAQDTKYLIDFCSKKTLTESIAEVMNINSIPAVLGWREKLHACQATNRRQRVPAVQLLETAASS